MIRRPPRSTLFPYRRSSDLARYAETGGGADTRAAVAGGIPAGARGVGAGMRGAGGCGEVNEERKSTRLKSSHRQKSYAVFCLEKKKKNNTNSRETHKEMFYT